AASAMARGLAGPHGQAAVEEHDSAVGPGRQVSVGCRWDAHVGLELGVDVHQTARQWTDVGRDRERQPHRVPRGRVGVLADDEHADPGERGGEGAEDRVRLRQIAAAGGDLRAQEVAHRRDPVRDGRHRLRPVRGHQLVQAHEVLRSARGASALATIHRASGTRKAVVSGTQWVSSPMTDGPLSRATYPMPVTRAMIAAPWRGSTLPAALKNCGTQPASPRPTTAQPTIATAGPGATITTTSPAAPTRVAWRTKVAGPVAATIRSTTRRVANIVRLKAP